MQEALVAAGHPGCQQGNGIFIKPCVQQEVDFYHRLLEKDSPLLDVVPVFMGTLVSGAKKAHDQLLLNEDLEQIDPDQFSQLASDGELSIVLRDELVGFVKPTIADIKLGFRLWDEMAPAAKKQRLDNVSKTTTSGSLGFRIAGMSVVLPDGSRKVFDKQFGREPTAENINDYLVQLFPQVENEYVWAVIDSIVQRIEHIIECLKLEPTKMYSCSLLIIYEGSLSDLQAKIEHQYQAEPEQDSDTDGDLEDEPAMVTVKLIDFAHSTLASEPDLQVIEGLNNVSKHLSQLKSV